MAIDSDLVMAKVASIERCLKRIEEVTGGDPTRLDDPNVADVFVLNLQRGAQQAIDLAQHLVAAQGLGLPGAMKEAFLLLQQAPSPLPSALVSGLCGMVGFRNIAVHAYEELQPAILAAILTEHLSDLRDFCAYAMAQIG